MKTPNTHVYSSGIARSQTIHMPQLSSATDLQSHYIHSCFPTLPYSVDKDLTWHIANVLGHLHLQFFVHSFPQESAAPGNGGAGNWRDRKSKFPACTCLLTCMYHLMINILFFHVKVDQVRRETMQQNNPRYSRPYAKQAVFAYWWRLEYIVGSLSHHVYYTDLCWETILPRKLLRWLKKETILKWVVLCPQI